MNIYRSGFVGLFISALFLPFNLFAEPLIPAASFGKLPKVHSMNISPDGKHIIALRAQGGTYHAVLTNLDTKQSSLLMAADPDNFLFDWCRFANNTRVLCKIRKNMVLKSGDPFVQRYRDGRTTFTRLLAINIDRSNQLQLVPKQDPVRDRQKKQWNAVNQSTIVSWLKDDPDHVLIELARDNRVNPSVYRLNINTNKLKRVRRHHESIFAWVANPKGKLLAGIGYTDTGKPTLLANKRNRFVNVDIDAFIGADIPSILSIAADNESAWVSANYQSNTRGIHRISLKDGSHLESILQLDDYDVNRLIIHPTSRQPIYATYHAEETVQYWFDPTFKAEHQKLVASLASKPSQIEYSSMSDDGNRLILYTSGSDSPPTWYLYDRKTAALSMISQSYTELGALTALKFVTYPASDGLEIPAYMALPGAAEDGPYPTIILPHGGPYLRDTQQFDYWVQFFVNRGYAVLKPNFRGSAGYGDEYLSRGFKQWGMKMQDDLIDGLDWMIENNYTDPNLVCIVGGSYGGYAALVASFKSPDRFNCAVSFAGVANLDDLGRRWRSFKFGGLAADRLQSGADRHNHSPIRNVDKVSIPLLLVHGDIDRRVMIEQSREFVTALDAAGKAHIYIEQTNGDHHLSLESHRIEFFEAMDSFLAKHLTKKDLAAIQ